MSKNIYVNALAFNNIKNKKKTIEGRIKRGLFNNLFVDDIVIFICNKTNIKCIAKITKINTYNSVYEFLTNENIHNIIPYINEYNDALNIYKKHYGQKLENKSFKFVAIHLVLI